MNRIALHQSTVHPLDPVGLVEVARGAGLDSIGLRVAAVADVEPWWSRGIGSPMLPDLVDALLTHRVTVLDVGRVPLGPELCVMDIGHPYSRVLELGTRLGAQFVTVRAGEPADDPVEFFARLAELAARYHLRPLLSPAAGTAVATLEQAIAIVDGTGGGVVLDIVPGRDDRAAVDEMVVELGELLGYVRVSARALAHTGAPGLLATLPPQVPVAIGGARRPARCGTATSTTRGLDTGRPGSRPARRGRRDAAPPAGDLRAEPRSRRRQPAAAASRGRLRSRGSRHALDGQFPGEPTGGQHQRRHDPAERRLLEGRQVNPSAAIAVPLGPQHRHRDRAPAGLQLAAARRHAVQPDALQRTVQLLGIGGGRLRVGGQRRGRAPSAPPAEARTPAAPSRARWRARAAGRRWRTC